MISLEGSSELVMQWVFVPHIVVLQISTKNVKIFLQFLWCGNLFCSKENIIVTYKFLLIKIVIFLFYVPMN